jgi:hypothetical protein
MKNITIYYDSLTEASWFEELNPAFSHAHYEIIKRRNQNPAIIEEIIKYDKPDIIVLIDGNPVLVLEKTSEVPTGHNIGQRFARLVRSIELGIPTIYYFPYDARKHGTYTSICNLNIRLLAAALKINTIHDTPLLCVNWLTDDHGELIIDGSENTELIALIKDYINSDYNKNCSLFNNYLEFMGSEYGRRMQIRPQYTNLPNSIQRENTHSYLTSISEKIDNHIIPQSFLNRSNTYVYTIGMTPAACKRQDPFTGTQFIYDYLVCRNGPKVSDKHANLILNFPNLTKDIWFANNQNNPNTKSSNWYLTANAFVFSDGFYFNL